MRNESVSVLVAFGIVFSAAPVWALSYPDLVLSNNPIAYWRLGEAGGPTAVDEVGTGGGANDGTYNGFAPGDFGQPGALKFDSNTAAQFDGADNFVDAGNDSSLNQSFPGLTLAAWVKPDSLSGGSQLVVGKWANTVANDHFGMFVIDDKALIAVADGSTGEGGLASTGSLVAGEWNFVVTTWSAGGGNPYQVYIDGQLDPAAGNQTGSGINTSSAKNLFIGAQNTPGNLRFFAGGIDEVAIFDRVLSASEISDLFEAASAFPIPEPSTCPLAAMAIPLLRRRSSRKRRSC